jgi:hypothetical protein
MLSPVMASKQWTLSARAGEVTLSVTYTRPPATVGPL